MIFNLHPQRFPIRVVPGRLMRERRVVGGLVHEGEILLSGELKPKQRLHVLLDVIRCLREELHGPIGPEGIAGFTEDIMGQLLGQGGNPALMRLDVDGMSDAGGAPELAAEPVGCECGQCGTRYGAHQIATSGTEFDHGSGKLVVRRSVECEFCNQVMSWTEGATGAGAPNGRVMSGPVYSRPHATSSP